VELHLHAAVFVGVDLVAGLAHHDRRLRALDDGLGGEPRWLVGLRRGDRLQAHAEEFGVGELGFGRAFFEPVVGAGDEVFLVLVGARVAHELEQPAAGEPERRWIRR
jgi:hypothetical protein